MTRRLTLYILLGLASLASAAAQTSPTPEPQTQEQLTLQAFGAKNPTCQEWNDGCATCKRDETGMARCSTPGIACQPVDPVCKAP